MEAATYWSWQKVVDAFINDKQPCRAWQSQFYGALRAVAVGETGNKTLSQDEVKQWLSAQHSLSLGQVWDWFNTGCQLLSLKQGTSANLRSKLNQFVNWCQQQEWFKLHDQIAIRLQSQRGQGRSIPSKTREKRGVSPSLRRIDRLVSPMPDYLIKAVASFRSYLTSKSEKRPKWDRKSPARWQPLKSSSADLRTESLFQYLGWMITEGNYSLSPQLIEESISEEAMKRYLDWLQEQGRSPNRIMSVISTLDCLLKWYYRSSYSTVEEYIGLEPVKWLRSARDVWQKEVKIYQTSKKKRQKRKSKMVNGEKNPLNWKTIKSVLPLLEQETRPKNYAGIVRSERGIAIRFQKYLLFAMFTLFVPIRQGEVRALKIGDSIVRGKDCWVLNLDPEMTKNGRRKRIGIEIWNHKLNQILDEWVNVHRPFLLKDGGIEHDHNYLFIQCRYTKGRGLPLIEVKNPRGSVASTIRNILWRYVGNDINPHFFRNLFNDWINKSSNVAPDAIRGITYLLDQSEEQWNETYRISEPDDEMQIGIDCLKKLFQDNL